MCVLGEPTWNRGPTLVGREVSGQPMPYFRTHPNQIRLQDLV